MAASGSVSRAASESSAAAVAAESAAAQAKRSAMAVAAVARRYGCAAPSAPVKAGRQPPQVESAMRTSARMAFTATPTSGSASFCST